MHTIIIFGAIMVGGILVVFIGWKCFFNWYKRKREADAQILIDSLSKKTFEDVQKII